MRIIRRYGYCKIIAAVIFVVAVFFLANIRLSFMIGSRHDAPPANSELIKEELIKLGEAYVAAVAKEDSAARSTNELFLHKPFGQIGFQKSIAALLDNIVKRLQALEDTVRNLRSGDRLPEPVESIVFHRSNNASDKSSCLPRPDELVAFPHCKAKVSWLRKFWKSDKCYAEYGVDGSDCSFVMYLSEVEHWCPKTHRDAPPVRVKVDYTNTTVEKAEIRTDIEELLNLLRDPGTRPNYAYIRLRIAHMWPQWVEAVKSLARKHNFQNRKKRQVLLHMGFLSKRANFKIVENVFKGGPLGELVQWSDLIASLYALGHQLIITSEVEQLVAFIAKHPGMKTPCQDRSVAPFDLLYIDIVGLKQIRAKLGASYHAISCLLRVLDSFGTEPQFNYMKYAKKRKLSTTWGQQNLNPQQFFTLFFHTPDNSFMGFVVEAPNATQVHNTRKLNQAVVYGKAEYMWEGKLNYIDVIHQSVEVHGTVGEAGKSKVKSFSLPKYLVNHGVLKPDELSELLLKSKFFVGMGFPYEGPAPLEAIASGCVFLNPRFERPHSSLNTPFFKGKPTHRELSSQHPYAARFIGRPYVYTIDMHKPDSVQEAIKHALNHSKFEPFLSYEHTHEGMLQRLNAYVEQQNFCQEENRIRPWIPREDITVFLSPPGQSCNEVCYNKDMICEPSHFQLINDKQSLQLQGITCAKVDSTEDIFHPSYEPKLSLCHLQAQHLLFSCANWHPNLQRLCPCRNYIPQQLALCKHCV